MATNGKNGPRTRPPRVAIIGSGLSGLCMAIQLKKEGFEDFTIFEKDGRIGGTWRDNTYPGSGCDVPSMFYSFSFEPKTDWSRAYASQQEILAYIEHCAQKYGLYPHIRFNAEIEEARFDEDAGVWRIRTRAGEEHAAEVLVTGCGQLNRPHTPDIPGLETFEGTAFHSARWDHSYDLRGKRVAVIGSGASAIQFVPEIAPQAAELHIFQRSPNYIIAKPDRPFSDRERALFTRFPLITKLYRAWIWAYHEIRWPMLARGKGILNRLLRGIAQRELARHVADPGLRKTLTPDYPIGCKRILISNDYFDTMCRDNVHIITDPIERVSTDGIVTHDGRSISADTLIFATGFDTTHFLAPIQIYGSGGLPLAERWRDGAEAYLGIAVDGFPNMFILYGPNTNLGHNSIIFMIECQVRYVMGCLRALVQQNLKYLDVRPGVMAAYNAAIQKRLGESVWAKGCHNWYRNEAGRITNNWAYSTLAYWSRTRRPDLRAFHCVEAESPSSKPVPAQESTLVK